MVDFAKASSRAAGISFLGIVLLLGSVAFAALRLAGIEREIDIRQAEVAALTGVVDSLAEREASLRAGIGALVEASSALTAASAARASSSGSVEPSLIRASLERATVEKVGLAGEQALLWVDDRNPVANRYEREALTAIGFEITLATNTEEAVETLAAGTYQLVVTDFGRRGDRQAAYTLLDAMAAADIRVPVIIYTDTREQSLVAAAIERGAFGQTNIPTELVELVLAATAS